MFLSQGEIVVHDNIRNLFVPFRLVCSKRRVSFYIVLLTKMISHFCVKNQCVQESKVIGWILDAFIFREAQFSDCALPPFLPFFLL